MIVKLLTDHHLEFLSLKEDCRASSKSTLVKMSNCWKSHAAAHFIMTVSVELRLIYLCHTLIRLFFKFSSIIEKKHA